MTIPEMIRLSLYLRSQKKEENFGNRKDDAEEGEKDDRDAGRGDWIRFFDLPEQVDEQLREQLAISLTRDEAAFLRQKIEKSVPDTLLSYILRNNIDLTRYDHFGVLYAALKDKVPSDIAQNMKLACDFNRMVYAARVRYNLLLSRRQNSDAISEWKHMEERMEWYAGVNLETVLHFLGRPDFRLRRFLMSLQTALLSGDYERGR